ncbi:uncharacterized protein [Nicotiana sylvestris]|uniref:uncharacterized protein n=1 Tax=Nicotiana sylvestris TaxID=4096 RepID=UPI00388C7DFA
MGFQSQPSGQQVTAPHSCFEYGDPGHMRRYCPRLWGKAVQQGQQPMISVPAAQPPRGGGQAGRGRPRGGGQAGRGQPATAQSGGGQPAGAPTRFYTLLTRLDALALDAIITGIISVGGSDASVLFDPGSIYSYVSSLFASFLVISPEPLGTPVHVSTLMGDFVVVDQIYRFCVVTFCGFETRADLLLLDMIDFDVILGMDWLSPYHAILDCHAKTVSLVMPGLPRLEWKGSIVDTPSRVISFLKARRMVENGCLAYLAYVRDITAESPTINSVPVVQEFTDVFPSDLPGMPPDRDIDFCIYLAPGTQPISIPPYCMASKELKELKEHLEELLAKGLTQKGAPFRWSNDCEESFQKLKTALTTTPVLIKAWQFDDPHLTVLRETVLQGGAKEVSIGEDGVLQLQGRLCVPNVYGLRERILEEAHSSRYSIHPGATKMYRDLTQHFWWRIMKKDIVEYVAKCLNCQQVKLTKSAYFIPVVTTYTSERYAQVYIWEIVRLHGVPVSIISDRGPQFTSHFWRAVQSELGTRVELSIAFHPQTDGLSERTVQILEDMLRACVIYFGGKWDQFLPLAKFAYNNSYQSSIEMAPYEALYGRRCCSPIEWFESGEAKLLGTDLVQDALDKDLRQVYLVTSLVRAPDLVTETSTTVG